MAEIYKTVFFKDSFIPFKDANLSIASSPVLYGLSTYTVIPVFVDKSKKQLNIFRLADHFKRLQNSAKILGFNDFLNKWDLASFSNVITKLIEKNKITEDCLVRVNVFVDAILGGIKMVGLDHQMAVFVYSMTEYHPKTGISLAVSSWRRNPDNAIPARAKISGGYVNVALMKNEVMQQGFDDAIALDDQGHVTESTVSNIFLVKDGQLITPGCSSDLLEGLTRSTIFALAEEQRLDISERVIDRSELYLADEAFLCGSSMSIVPISSIDHRLIGDKGKPGRITKLLDEGYNNMVRGTNSQISHWLTAVRFQPS